MLIVLYASALLILAAIPAALIARNLPLFERPRKAADEPTEPMGISILIPARNEQAGIARAVQSVLANDYEPFEVIVLDDASEDDTAAIVAKLSDEDSRVQLQQSVTLPEGWNGKQHACWQLANLARYDTFLFLDADVILQPNALQECADQLRRTHVDLLSGFPRQVMKSWSEQWLIPMMYYLLLGYLPLDRMRATTQPEFGAGCGQLFLSRRIGYFQADGHRAIQHSRHDGLMLPRSFRAAGLRTDLFDASEIAEVRMYCGLREVIPGVLKNATEGIANAKLIGVFSVLLIGGSVLPVLSLVFALGRNWAEQGVAGVTALVLLALATLLGYLGRFLISRRLGHSGLAVVFHPIAVGWFMLLQWYAFLRAARGKAPTPWRGRL